MRFFSRSWRSNELPILRSENGSTKGSKNGAKMRDCALTAACGAMGSRAPLGPGKRRGIPACVERLVVAQISGAAFVLAVADSEPFLLHVLGIITACLPSRFTSTHSAHHDISRQFNLVVLDLHNNNNNKTRQQRRQRDVSEGYKLGPAGGGEGIIYVIVVERQLPCKRQWGSRHCRRSS